MAKAMEIKAATMALQQSEVFKAHDDGDDAAIFMARLSDRGAAHASECLPPCPTSHSHDSTIYSLLEARTQERRRSRSHPRTAPHSSTD